MITNIKHKTSNDILEEFAEKTDHNTLEGEQYSAAIYAKSSQELQAAAKQVSFAIDNFNKSMKDSSNDLRLSSKDIQESVDSVKFSVENFNSTVRDIGKSSDNLSNKLFWLNIILTMATIIASIAAVIALFKNS